MRDGNEKPLHHGRDHRKGGEDPIPGLIEEHVWPQWYRIPLMEFSSSPLGGVWGAPITKWDNWVIDATCYNGGYIEETDDGAQAEFRLKLGPQYSTWAVIPSGVTDTDGGILTIDFGTTSEDSTDTGSWNEVRGLMADDPLNLGSGDGAVTYVRPSSSGGIDPNINAYDFYSATRQINSFPSLGALFRIGGEDGDPFTTIDVTGSLAEFVPFAVWDGGAGLYSCRLKIDGSSHSGHAVRLSSLLIARVSGRQVI